ncbi:hypothetical protein K470DRAFT_255223 [Piedraia hortae CBS 480.64]|uniref:Uncharacterized protein n=1 Tax=Piedraia hortae CBS 480.64 TaxID=1314780 RepID=A0A6A7C6I7_9PEZI|nr:hypothetical protein K470DRAFT_255223 [Piedraia hortae CBS 480.64]
MMLGRGSALLELSCCELGSIWAPGLDLCGACHRMWTLSQALVKPSCTRKRASRGTRKRPVTLNKFHLTVALRVSTVF